MLGKNTVSNNKYFKAFHIRESVSIPFYYLDVGYRKIQTDNFDFTSSLLEQEARINHNTSICKTLIKVLRQI